MTCWMQEFPATLGMTMMPAILILPAMAVGARPTAVSRWLKNDGHYDRSGRTALDSEHIGIRHEVGIRRFGFDRLVGVGCDRRFARQGFDLRERAQVRKHA